MRTFEDFRNSFGMSLVAISRRFNIPYRTVQNWNQGVNSPPDYVIEMMFYIVSLEIELKVLRESRFYER